MKYLGYGFLGLLTIIVVGAVTITIANNPSIRSGTTNLLAVASPLEIDKTEHSYGDIDIHGGNAVTKFTLTNSGTEPIAIKKLFTSCMCTTASIDGQTFGMHSNPYTTITVEPQSSKELTVAFDPLAHGDTDAALGPVTRQIYIGTNSTVTPEIELKLTGNVIKK